MIQPTITLTKSGSGLEYIREAVSGLNQARVLVGIPEAETSRDDEAITNAALMYIHTNGSEVMNIPKRPVIEPSIEADRAQLEDALGKAITAELDGETEKCNSILERVGTRATNDAKRWFTDPRNGWQRNKLSTIKRKLSKLTGKRYRKAMEQLMSAGETGDVSELDTPLIDTGQLRRAITYIVEGIE